MKGLITAAIILGTILSLSTTNPYLIAREKGSPAPETIGQKRA